MVEPTMELTVALIVEYRSNRARAGMRGGPDLAGWTHGVVMGRYSRLEGGRAMLQGILGSLVWIVATVAYVSYVREGRRGFRRLAAFWLGFPWTLCSSFLLPHSRRFTEPVFDELEDEETLLMEIRRDRARRNRLAEGRDEGADAARDKEA